MEPSGSVYLYFQNSYLSSTLLYKTDSLFRFVVVAALPFAVAGAGGVVYVVLVLDGGGVGAETAAEPNIQPSFQQKSANSSKQTDPDWFGLFGSLVFNESAAGSGSL